VEEVMRKGVGLGCLGISGLHLGTVGYMHVDRGGFAVWRKVFVLHYCTV